MDVRGDIDQIAPGFLAMPRPRPVITGISAGVSGSAAS
jgi:hypothetical protein